MLPRGACTFDGKEFLNINFSDLHINVNIFDANVIFEDSALPSQQTQDFLYSVTISPTFVKVQQGEFGAFAVKVARGSDMGAFSVDLSLIADSLPLKAVATFSPAQLILRKDKVLKTRH